MEGKRQHLQNALNYVQQGRLDRAIAEYEAILRAQPDDCNVLNALGDLCARTGNKAEAIGYFMRLAEAYRLDGLYVRAVAVYKKMLKLDPTNADASLACGELYAEQGLIAEAKLQFQGLADHYLRKGDITTTIEMYEKMIRLDPGNSPTLHKLASVLVRPGGVEEALTKLNGLGERLIGVGQSEDARQIYEKAMELLRSQGREADAARFAKGLNTFVPDEEEREPEEEVPAAVFPGVAVPPEQPDMVIEEAASLEIMPGSAIESAIEPEEVPVLEVSGLIEELKLGGEAWGHASPKERLEVDVSIGDEVESLDGGGPAAIELDPSEQPDELATITGEAQGVELVGTQTLDDELQEGKFFMQQGMLREARAIFQRILSRDPDHRQAKLYMAEIEGSEAAPAIEEHPRTEVKKPSIFRVTDAEAPQEAFVDLAGQLSEELSQGESSVAGDLEPEVQHMLNQLDQGIRDQLDVDDYETHYNLGLAYKDLELYEKAIEEFRLAANDASYRVRCASLVGLCYLAKGDPERSVEEFLKGLTVARADTEERWGILYDLATAYEAFGDVRKALETLTTIHSEAPKFRDVRARIRDVRIRLERSRGTSS